MVLFQEGKKYLSGVILYFSLELTLQFVCSNMSDWQQYLKKIYYNPKHPDAFAGPQKLCKIVQDENIYNISRSKIRQWLQDQDVYSLTKPIKRKFKRNRIVPTKQDSQWDMDLADVSNLAKNNDGVKFLLVVIDLFSRYLWVHPLKGKTHQDVLNGLNEILKDNRKLEAVRSDKGSEFANRWVKKFMRDFNIYYFTSQNETKANYAECVIRSLKSLIYRYMFQKQSHRYVDVLPDFVSNYNNRRHRSLGNRTPASVGPNEPLLWKFMYTDSLKPKSEKTKHVKATLQHYKYKVGDHVRISHLKQ